MLDVGVPVAVPLPIDVPLEVIVDNIEIESVPLKLDPRVGDDDGVFAMLEEILIVLVNVAIAVGESEPVPQLDGDVDGEGTTLDVILALPPNEIVDSGVADDDDARLSVIEGVDRGVDEPLSVEEELSLLDVVAEGVGTALDVILALPPKEIVDGGVSDDDNVERGVGVIVNVFELVIAAETLELAVGVTVLEPVDESEPVSAPDDEVVSVAEKLFDGVSEDEVVCVNDGIISDDEGVVVTKLVMEDDKLEEIDAVTLGETVLLEVEDVDAPRVTEVVGVLETEELKVCVNVDVSELLGVPVVVGEVVARGETLAVKDTVDDDVPTPASVIEGV